MTGNEQQPNPGEMAALELYHQLVNLSADHQAGDNALMLTLRLPNGRYVGDVWLSAADVERLTDGTIALTSMAAFESAAAPLPVDDTVTEDEVDEVLAGFHNLLNPNGGQQ